MNEAAPRLRLRAPVVPEEQLHEAVAKALTFLVLPPAVFVPYPAGWVQLSPAQAAKMSRMGLRRGMPDWLGYMPGQHFGIELKREGGRISTTRMVRTHTGALRVLEGQDVMFARLARAGMVIAVCRSVGEVLEALDRWGVPRRRTT